MQAASPALPPAHQERKCGPFPGIGVETQQLLDRSVCQLEANSTKLFQCQEHLAENQKIGKVQTFVLIHREHAFICGLGKHILRYSNLVK